MDKITELAIENIHPKWKVLLGTPGRDGRLLIDILDETVTKIIDLNVKLCPDNPRKILRCLHLDPDLIKVIIIGQDVYPQPGVATGLAFAVEDGKPSQPSLNILLREMWEEYGFPGGDDTFNSSLEQWEEQGVLLINTALSCEQFKPGSHSKLWEPFFAELMVILNNFKVTRESMTSMVFVFLGSRAYMFESEIGNTLHYKISRYHPAAETYGGNKFTGFFKEVNKCLEESNQEQISWI